jgi:F-type H+-transporting ATPase subunit b
MESTLAALGGLLLKAAPTFILVLVLHFYLKYIFFKPLQRVLDQRYAATEGAKKQAEDSLRAAAAKTAEYEAAMRAARAEIYQAQESLFERLEEKRKQQVQAARVRADAAIHAAKAELARDVEEAKRTLSRETESLADEIAQSILSRRAA